MKTRNYLPFCRHPLEILAISVVFLTLTVGATNDFGGAPLEAAKKSYAAAIQAAKRALAAEYEKAIKEAMKGDDLDGAIAIRQQRDEFLASSVVDLGARDPDTKVEDGWTILSRSDNPLVFDVPLLNKKSYSVPGDRTPRNTKYVRVRRMDTEGYIVLPLITDNIAANKFGVRYGWRGDKRLNKQACCLGIVDLTTETRNSCVMLLASNGTKSAGWGFCEMWSGPERQGYVWAGDEIPRTTMEIAATNRELTDQERAHLVK